MIPNRRPSHADAEEADIPVACAQVNNRDEHETARILTTAGDHNASSVARAILEVQWYLSRDSKGCLHVGRVASDGSFFLPQKPPGGPCVGDACVHQNWM